MTTWAPDYTLRYKLRYLAGGYTHDMVVRGTSIGTAADLADMAADIETAFAAIEGNLFEDFTFQAASYALPNSNVFVPTTIIPTSPTGAIAVADYSARVKASAVAMSGRSATAKARIYFFGFVVTDQADGTPGGDGVVTGTEVVPILGFRALAANFANAADGSTATYYPRFTIKVNDRWLRFIRRTGG